MAAESQNTFIKSIRIKFYLLKCQGASLQDNNTISFIIFSWAIAFLKIIPTSLWLKRENQLIIKLFYIENLLVLPLFITYAEESKLVNMDSLFKTIKFSIVYQAAASVLIPVLVFNAPLDMFWIQTTIVSDVVHYALHVHNQLL